MTSNVTAGLRGNVLCVKYELIETVNDSVTSNATTGSRGSVLCVKYELV